MENNASNDPIEISQGETGAKFSYPYKSFEQILAFVVKIYNDLGHDVYHTKDQIAAVHNLAANSIKQILSNAQLFGLLEIKHGTGYKTTDLFARIQLPANDEEKKASVLEALKSCELYSEILSTYEKSGILPNNTGLSNTLTRQYKFSEQLASKIAKDFVGTLRSYGFIDDKNILKLTSKSQISTPIITEPTLLNHNPLENKKHINDEEDRISIVIPLKGKRKATLMIPEDWGNDDIKRIGKFVSALSDELDDN